MNSVDSSRTGSLDSTVTANQSVAYGCIRNGPPISVVPAGQRAIGAGLTPGTPISIAPTVEMLVNSATGSSFARIDMSMKIQEVRDALFPSLQSHLPTWKLVKKDQAFVRPIAGGTQKVVVPIVDYNPEFRISLTFVTRIDRVEDIVNQFNAAPARYHKTTLTTMTQLAYFFPGEPEPKQYSVKTPADVQSAADSLGAVLEEKAVPLFDAHAHIAQLDAAMNGGDTRFDTSDRTSRSIRALTLAKLAGNPRFEDLAASYQAAISHFPDLSKQSLSKVIEHLRTLQT